MKKILLLSVMLGGICMNAAAMNNVDLAQANPTAEVKKENATPVVEHELPMQFDDEEVEVSTEGSVSPLSEPEDTDSMDEENMSIEELEKEKWSLIAMIDHLQNAQRVAQDCYAKIYNDVVNLIKRKTELVAVNRSLEEQKEKICKNIERLESENKEFKQSIQTLKRDFKFESIFHVVDLIGVSLITAIIIFKFMDINDVIRACAFVRRYFNYEYLWSVLKESSLYEKMSQGILAWW